MELKPVAYYRGPFGSKFGIPRQSGLAGAVTGRIVFEPAFRDANAVRGLEGFDRIWLIWGFSANRPAKGEWQPTVRPPRLGGNARLGVWATRSPFRPKHMIKIMNYNELSYDEIFSRFEPTSSVEGVVSDDPALTLPHPRARERAFVTAPLRRLGIARLSDGAPVPVLQVVFQAEPPFPEEDTEALRQILSLDPRPACQQDAEKSFGFPFQGFDIRFQVSIKPEALGANGQDNVCFLFSANTSTPLQPVAQVASGGETGRVMLSLKAMISGVVKLPTIIFDEIDTGVSGKIAEKMAEMMHEMGQQERQVISITHLPQIAALGTHHYRVSKEETPQGTTSHMQELSADERVTEIAQMLSGSNVTDAAVANAKQLLGSKL